MGSRSSRAATDDPFGSIATSHLTNGISQPLAKSAGKEPELNHKGRKAHEEILLRHDSFVIFVAFVVRGRNLSGVPDECRRSVDAVDEFSVWQREKECQHETQMNDQ